MKKMLAAVARQRIKMKKMLRAVLVEEDEEEGPRMIRSCGIGEQSICASVPGLKGG